MAKVTTTRGTRGTPTAKLQSLRSRTNDSSITERILTDIAQRAQAFAATGKYLSPWEDGGQRLFTAMQSSIEAQFMRDKGHIRERDLLTLMLDDEIAEVVETRRSGATTVPWQLVPPDGKKKLREEDKFVEAELKRVIRPLLHAAWMAVMQGRSVTNIVYRKVDNNRTGLDKALEVPFEQFTYKNDGMLYQRGSYRADATDTPVDPLQLFGTVRNPTVRNPNGEMMLLRLYIAWSYRCNLWDYWMQTLDRCGTPFLVAKVKDPGYIVDRATKQTMLSLVTATLDRARRGSGMAVGPEDDIKAVDVSGTGAQFAVAEAAVTKRIRLLVLGQTGTTDLADAGAYAAAKVHNEVRMDKRDDDVALIVDTVQRVVVALWQQNEFTGVPPTFVMRDAKTLETGRAARDKDLVPALTASGLRFTKAYFTDEYGIADEYLEQAPALTAVAAPQTSPAPNVTPGAGAQSLAALFAASAQRGATELADAVTEDAARTAPEVFPLDEMRKVLDGTTDLSTLQVRLARYMTVTQMEALAQHVLNARAAAAATGALTAVNHVH
jgi:phage gp29-like protein